MPSISPENLPLLKALLLLTLFAHFSLAGVLLGSTSVAVLLDVFGRLDRRRHWRALAVDLVGRVVPGRGTALLLTPTAALILLSVQLGYPPLLPAGLFWALTLAPLFLGLAALAGYRRLLPREEGSFLLASSLGAAGVLLGLVSFVLLCCGAGLLVMPEKWPFLAATPRLVLSWVGTARFLEFTCLSLASTGGLMLLLGSRPPAEGRAAEYAIFVRRAGAALALVFLLGWPCAVLLGLINLPAIALSGAALAASAAALAVAAGLALSLLRVLERPERTPARPIFSLFLVLFALWLLGDHAARESALGEESLAGLAVAALPPPAPPAAAAEEEAADGKAVFERLCATCHRFDERLVGPPLASVVPEYRGRLEELKAFIRDPVKKDPDYPAMPKLQLSEAEIDAVARYLLERVAP